jgi:transcriptional regulator with XRE-family HTH domain
MPSRGPSPRARTNTPHVTLKTLRQAQGLTQNDIAARLGISVPVVSRYETGDREIPARILGSFAAAYGIEPGEIVWGPADADAGADDEEPPLRRAAGL